MLVIEEIFGVHEYIKDTCRRLAKLGYLAVAPELYARIGDLSGMTDVNAIVRDVISKAPDDRMLQDLDSAAAWAAQNGGDPARLAVTGFCRGGRNTWMYNAHNPALKAAVAWYGPIKGRPSPIQPTNPEDIAADIKAPLLGMYGGQDTGIAVADVQAAAAKARAAGKTVEIVVFPRRSARLPCGLPSQLPQGRRGGWLGTDAGLVQKVRRLALPCPLLLWERAGLPRVPTRACWFR